MSARDREEARMSELKPLFPRRLVPELKVPLVGGGTFDLAAEKPEHFSLVVFYRGLHCPLCRAQLEHLETKLAAFDERGVSVVALSCDSRERAERAKAEWGLSGLRLGYGLDLDTARAWGLYVSDCNGVTLAGVEEPALFAEPGLFLVHPDGALHLAVVQTTPFARPKFDDVLGAVDFIVERQYPARGDITSLPRKAA